MKRTRALRPLMKNVRNQKSDSQHHWPGRGPPFNRRFQRNGCSSRQRLATDQHVKTI